MVPSLSESSVTGILCPKISTSHLVPYLSARAGDIQHTGVHADIAQDRDPPAPHHHLPYPAAQMTVQTVRVAHRDDRHVRRPADPPLASVAYRLVGSYPAYRSYMGLECAHRPQTLERTYAVQPDAHAHHIEGILGEALYAGAVENMPQYLIGEMRLHHPRHLLEQADLPEGKLVLRRVVRSCQMGEHAPQHHRPPSFHELQQFRYVFLIQTRTVHPRI